MSTANQGRKRRGTYLMLTVIVVLALTAFSVFWYQTQTIARLERGGTFSRTVVLLPRTDVILHPCTRTGCDVANIWEWSFPSDRSLEYPGYLNVTVYYSNSTVGFLSVRWSWSNGNGSGAETWDYSQGSFPRTTPGWLIVPVLREMVGLQVDMAPPPQSILGSKVSISISYYF